MPLDKLIRAGMEGYKAAKQPPKPTSQKAPPPPKVKPQAKANMAADMFKVPGRGAIRKRNKMIEDL